MNVCKELTALLNCEALEDSEARASWWSSVVDSMNVLVSTHVGTESILGLQKRASSINQMGFLSKQFFVRDGSFGIVDVALISQNQQPSSDKQ